MTARTFYSFVCTTVCCALVGCSAVNVDTTSSHLPQEQGVIQKIHYSSWDDCTKKIQATKREVALQDLSHVLEVDLWQNSVVCEEQQISTEGQFSTSMKLTRLFVPRSGREPTLDISNIKYHVRQVMGLFLAAAITVTEEIVSLSAPGGPVRQQMFVISAYGRVRVISLRIPITYETRPFWLLITVHGKALEPGFAANEVLRYAEDTLTFAAPQMVEIR